MKTFILIIMFLVTSALSARAQCWDHYEKTTLSEHMKKFKLSDSPKWTHYEAHRGRLMYAVWYRNVGIDGTPITVPVKYSAELRKIGEVAKEAIFMFGGEEIQSLFTYEMHVVDKGIDIWVPIQESLFEHLKKELKKNDTFIACLVLIGRLEKNHLYIMNDFEVP